MIGFGCAVFAFGMLVFITTCCCSQETPVAEGQNRGAQEAYDIGDGDGGGGGE